MFNNELWQKPTGGAAGGNFYSHQIANSIRADTNNGYLHRTPSSAGNRSTWTFSTWIKLAQMGTGTRIIYSAGSSGNQDGFYRLFYNANKLIVGSANANFVTPSDTFRDPSAWQHIVWKQGSNATTLYVNGEQIATASVSGNTAVNNNTIQCIGTSSYGGSPTNTEHLDGYFAETIMIDGTALDADSFGETKNGVWIPKDASGLTYGTNGFRLSYGNASDLGEDSAGSNDWTAVNLATHDQTGDTPAFNSSSNGGNFATLGILWKTPDMTFSEGNLRANTTTNNRGVMSNWEVPDGDKWYWEIYPTIASGEQWLVGINYATVDFTSDRGGRATGVSYDSFDGKKRVDNNTASSYGSSWATGDIIGIAVDRVNDTIQFYKNGSGQGTIDISGLNNTEFFPWCGCGGGSGDNIIVYNFGAEGTFAGSTTAGGNADVTGYGNFKYDPGDYKALCAGNLPVVAEIDPAQTDDDYPQKLFGMLQYTGNGSERTIDTSFQIDYSWARSTVQGQNWYALDTTRGYFGASSNNLYMALDLDDAEDTFSQYNFKAQSGSDITITSGTGFNSGSHTQQMWNWRLNGGTTATNSTGSVSVTQQVDPSGHFSVSTYSGAGGTGTIGHGLSAVPTFVVVKQRNGSNSWATYAKGAGPELYGNLATNTAFQDAVVWQDTAPSSSLVYLGDNNEVNHSGRTYLAYCWADCEGYIKSGKYVGNGDVDGTFIYLGFKPALFVIKHVSSGDDPLVWDSKNGPYNPISKTLSMHDNSAIVDNSNRHVDFLSNGVKIRTTNSNANSTNSDGIVYLAMAHNPFKYATAR